MDVELPSYLATPRATPSPSVTPVPSSHLSFPSTSATPITPEELESTRIPTPTGRHANEPFDTFPRRGKKIKFSDENTLPKELVNAAIERLVTPKPADDELATFGKLIGQELKTLEQESPMQATIAKKLIHDVMFMGSMNNLTMDTQICTVGCVQLN